MTLIHQTLHGYSNGHKLLSASLNLDSYSKKIMLRESDSPGDGFHQQNEPCYTGYPLNESGFYVLSKTWNAFEIKRPGCVWTHSILIPFEVLECITSSFNVLKLFYDPIDFQPNQDLTSISLSLESQNYNGDFSLNTGYLAQSLSDDRPLLINNNIFSISDVISLINLIWPSLRKKFSFRTWSPKKISSYSNYFNYSLLFCSNDRDFDFNRYEDDFLPQDIFGLKEFFWKYGTDNYSDVSGLVKAYKYIKLGDKKQLSNHILKWKNIPRKLVVDIIGNIVPEDVSLQISYIIGSYILMIKIDDIDKEVLRKSGEILYLNDRHFFEKVVDARPSVLPLFVDGVIDQINLNTLLCLYDEGYLNAKSILPHYEDLDDSFWTRLLVDGEIKSLSLSDLSHLDLPSFVVQSIDYKSYSDDECAKFLVKYFDSLDSSQLNYLFSNYIKFISNEYIGFIEKESFNDSFISCNSLDFLTHIDDRFISKIFEFSSKNDQVCNSILWVFISSFNINRVKLLSSSLKYLIEFVSNGSLSFNDKYKIRSSMKVYIKEKYLLPITLKDVFSSFMYAYVKRHRIDLSGIEGGHLINDIKKLS